MLRPAVALARAAAAFARATVTAAHGLTSRPFPAPKAHQIAALTTVGCARWPACGGQTASVHFSTAAAQQLASGAGTTVVASSKARTFWVKKEGDPRFVKLRSTAADVDDLIEEIVRRLGLTERLSTLIVYVAQDEEGKALGPPLDSRTTVAAAGLESGASIVIKAAGAAAAPGAAATPGTPAQLLLAALPHAKEIKIPGEGDDGCSLLVLQDAAGKRLEWPGLQSDTLFIRPVYREFFEREDMLNCFERREVDEAPFTLVRGIPGIGKSSFALYCLWRLATAGKHVLYSYPLGLGTSAVVDFGSGPRSDAVFIADGTDGFREPAGVRLLVTSPRQDYIPEFEKHAISFYMPQPMWAELRLMRDTCFVHRAAALSDAVLEQRVLRWGRVPRFVLSHSSDEVDTLETIMRQLSVPSLRRLLLERGSTRDQQDETYRVVHYKFAHDAGDDGTYPRDSDTAAALDGGAGEATAPELYGWPLPAGTPRRVYKPAGMRWATPSMQDRMWAFFIDNMSDDRVSLLGDLFRDKAILQFSGTLWEKWASLAMARGSALGGFCIRRLTHGSDGQTAGLDADAFLGIDKQRPGMPWLLRVPPAKCADFDDLADLSAQLAVAAAQGGAAPRVRYVAPRGFASIDFLEAQLLRAASSNASVSAKHDLIVQGKQVGNGLRAIVAAAPALRPKNAAGVADEPLIHLWLVSGLVFDACEAGPLEIPPKAAPSRIAMLSPAQQITARLLNDAVDDAKALAPHVVQYAVKLPDPDAHLRAPRAADQSTSVPVPSST